MEEPKGPQFSKRPYKTRRRREFEEKYDTKKSPMLKGAKKQRNPRKGANDPRIALERVLKKACKIIEKS